MCRITFSRHGEVLSWIVYVIHRSMRMHAPGCHRMSESVVQSLLDTVCYGVYASRGRSELLVARVPSIRL